MKRKQITNYKIEKIKTKKDVCNFGEEENSCLFFFKNFQDKIEEMPIFFCAQYWLAWWMVEKRGKNNTQKKNTVKAAREKEREPKKEE